MVLSLQLSFAVVPLVRFTGSKQKMGPFASRWWLQVLAWVVTVVIMALNGKLVYEQIGEWIDAAGELGLAGGRCCACPCSLGLGVLLLWMIFRRERLGREAAEVSADQIAAAAPAPAPLPADRRRPGRPADRRGHAGRGRRAGQHPSGRTGADARRRRRRRHLVRRRKPATRRAATTNSISERWPSGSGTELHGARRPGGRRRAGLRRRRRPKSSTSRGRRRST